MNTDDGYWIELNGARRGPMNLATAKAAVAGLPEARVWKDGWPAWLPAKEAFGIRAAVKTLSTENLRSLARTLVSAGSWMQICAALVGLFMVMAIAVMIDKVPSPAPALIMVVLGTGSILGFLFTALLFKAGGEALAAFAQISEDVRAIRERK